MFGEKAQGENSPAYDNGKWLRERFEPDTTQTVRRQQYRKAWKTCFWVMEPMLADRQELLATDVKISARINKPYAEDNLKGANEGFPLYQFGFENPSNIEDADRLVSVIDNINKFGIAQTHFSQLAFSGNVNESFHNSRKRASSLLAEMNLLEQKIILYLIELKIDYIW